MPHAVWNPTAAAVTGGASFSAGIFTMLGGGLGWSVPNHSFTWNTMSEAGAAMMAVPTSALVACAAVFAGKAAFRSAVAAGRRDAGKAGLGN